MEVAMRTVLGVPRATLTSGSSRTSTFTRDQLVRLDLYKYTGVRSPLTRVCNPYVHTVVSGKPYATDNVT